MHIDYKVIISKCRLQKPGNDYNADSSGSILTLPAYMAFLLFRKQNENL